MLAACTLPEALDHCFLKLQKSNLNIPIYLHRMILNYILSHFVIITYKTACFSLGTNCLYFRHSMYKYILKYNSCCQHLLICLSSIIINTLKNSNYLPVDKRNGFKK